MASAIVLFDGVWCQQLDITEVTLNLCLFFSDGRIFVQDILQNRERNVIPKLLNSKPMKCFQLKKIVRGFIARNIAFFSALEATTCTWQRPFYKVFLNVFKRLTSPKRSIVFTKFN